MDYMTFAIPFFLASWWLIFCWMITRLAKSDGDTEKASSCLCTTAQSMVGEGCEVCNPAMAAEIASRNESGGEK